MKIRKIVRVNSVATRLFRCLDVNGIVNAPTLPSTSSADTDRLKMALCCDLDHLEKRNDRLKDEILRCIRCYTLYERSARQNGVKLDQSLDREIAGNPSGLDIVQGFVRRAVMHVIWLDGRYENVGVEVNLQSDAILRMRSSRSSSTSVSQWMWS